MVGFLHAYRVLWETIHDFSQIAVYGRENGHTDAEIDDITDSIQTFLNGIVDFVMHSSDVFGNQTANNITAGKALNGLGGESLLNPIKLRMADNEYLGVTLREISFVVERETAQTHS